MTCMRVSATNPRTLVSAGLEAGAHLHVTQADSLHSIYESGRISAFTAQFAAASRQWMVGHFSGNRVIRNRGAAHACHGHRSRIADAPGEGGMEAKGTLRGLYRMGTVVGYSMEA